MRMRNFFAVYTLLVVSALPCTLTPDPQTEATPPSQRQISYIDIRPVLQLGIARRIYLEMRRHTLPAPLDLSDDC